MRAKKNESPEQIRERYLGEIAPMLAAARTVETLPDDRRRQVRRRIVRTLFGSRSLRMRFRLMPVLAGLGLVVAGGVAFATAERFGLIRFGSEAAPDRPAATPPAEKRRAGHLKRTGRPGTLLDVPSADATETVVLPDLPDPLLAAPAGSGNQTSAPLEAKPSARPEMPATSSAPAGVRAPAVAAKHPDVPAGVPATNSRRPERPTKNLALASPYLADRPGAGVAAVAPASPTDQAGAPLTPPATSPAVEWPGSVSPSRAPVLSPPSPAARQEAAPAPSPLVQPPPEAAKPRLSGDAVLFGQALRKLRNQNDPAGALAALHEHALAYPHSTFDGERNALEVEALLALHRDREALQRLDAMALDRLPRSGERFVVRGELRAAARRWQEAEADFDKALGSVTGSPAWHERALWGRGVARLHCGEQKAGMADIERYRELYPKGRFAAEAVRFPAGR